MIIKGKQRSGGRNLAAHLARTDTNETAELVELRGVAARSLRGARGLLRLADDLILIGHLGRLPHFANEGCTSWPPLATSVALTSSSSQLTATFVAVRPSTM